MALASVIVLTGCSALHLGAPAFNTSTVNGTQIPMQMPRIDGGHPFITVSTTVAGGAAVPLLVDTGSPGVRVFANKVGSTGITRTDTPVSVTFADGTTFGGVEASAPVSFGGLTTSGPINIQLITAVSCADGHPECAGAGGIKKFADTQAFSGILGLGMQSADIYSPMSQLSGGSPTSFSITSTPAVGTATMTLNSPPTSPIATYSMQAWTEPQLPNGYPAWASNQAQACWAYGGQSSTCVPTAFDTGSPTLFTDGSVAGAPSVTGPVAAGTTLAMTATAGGVPIWSVTAGSTPGKNTVQVESLQGGNNVNTGISVFAGQVVTFDLENGNVLISRAS